MVSKNSIRSLLNRHKDIDPKIYHNAQELLKIYSDVVWNNIEEYSDVVSECNELYGLSSYKGLEIMAEIGEEQKAIELRERLMNVAENKIMIDAIEKALSHVKAYRYNGEVYFDIINKNYFIKNKCTEDDMLEDLCISRSTYYRKRKEAIHLFGIYLWGFVIPKVINTIPDTETG